MKKLATMAIAFLVLTVTFVASFAVAQGPTLTSANNAKIWTRSVFGTGIAISQSDPMDFEFLNIGVAKVKFVSNENDTVRLVGILKFGERKFRLRDVAIGNGSASASVYYNNSQVGSLSLDSYVRGDREVWAGSLTLDGSSYNAYVIQIPKILKAVEKAGYIHEYCKNNPERCRATMKAVGNVVCDPVTDQNCRDRIKNFCEQQPDDNRCKALRLAYCRSNTEDSDCRAELMDVCKSNTTNAACNVIGEIYSKKIDVRPQALNKAPEWLKTVRDRIKANLPGTVGGE